MKSSDALRRDFPQLDARRLALLLTGLHGSRRLRAGSMTQTIVRDEHGEVFGVVAYLERWQSRAETVLREIAEEHKQSRRFAGLSDYLEPTMAPSKPRLRAGLIEGVRTGGFSASIYGRDSGSYCSRRGGTPDARPGVGPTQRQDGDECPGRPLGLLAAPRIGSDGQTWRDALCGLRCDQSQPISLAGQRSPCHGRIFARALPADCWPTENELRFLLPSGGERLFEPSPVAREGVAAGRCLALG